MGLRFDKVIEKKGVCDYNDNDDALFKRTDGIVNLLLVISSWLYYYVFIYFKYLPVVHQTSMRVAVASTALYW